MSKRKYFSLEKANQTATINIYGDICSWAFEEYGEMSSQILSKQLEALGDVNEIHVYINSYGGEVAEGLAIYNALRRHKAKIITYCDGFACSIASVIFMAGDERVMNEASLLMIHNAWTWASGNAAELRKQAEDLDKITQASVEAYKAHSSISEEKIKALMDAETWILPSEAIEYGFATAIETQGTSKTSQSAFKQLMNIVMAHQQAEDDDKKPEGEEPEGDEPDGNDPEGDENKKDEPKTDDEEGNTDDESGEGEDGEESTQQMLRGFFNAISKM